MRSMTDVVDNTTESGRSSRQRNPLNSCSSAQAVKRPYLRSRSWIETDIAAGADRREAALSLRDIPKLGCTCGNDTSRRGSGQAGSHLVVFLPRKGNQTSAEVATELTASPCRSRSLSVSIAWRNPSPRATRQPGSPTEIPQYQVHARSLFRTAPASAHF